ncbi:hypothetical protein H0X48_05510 [Candidatus Dependentiae bacterium]|nr:hypothetical protein [Candidatus Dependentiae bacterium]
MDVIKVAIGVALMAFGLGSYTYFMGIPGIVIAVICVLVGLKILLDGIGRGFNI